MARLLELVFLLKLVYRVQGTVGGTNMQEMWFSAYGAEDTGRDLSDGVYQGDMSRIQCSLRCVHAGGDCVGLDFDASQGRIGPCYIFDSHTHNRVMISAPGHIYVEKRSCREFKQISAAVAFYDSKRFFMFHEEYYDIYQTYTDPNMITSLYSPITYNLDYTFSNVVPPITAAFKGATTNTLYLIDGKRQLHEFSTYFGGYYDLWMTIGPSTALDNFFSLYPDITISAAVNTDAGDLTKINIIGDGKDVYNLVLNGASYDFIDHKSLSDPGHLWSGLPYNVTALAKLETEVRYIAFEKDKLYDYSTSNERVYAIRPYCKPEVPV